MMNYSIAIMSGGQSRRFGADKTLSKLNNKPIINYILETCAPYTDDLFIVAKDIEKYRSVVSYPIVQDQFEQQCPLVGIITALTEAKHDHVIILPADAPLFRHTILKILISAYTSAVDAVVPILNDKTYPLTALYHKNMNQKLIECFQQNEYKLFKILKQFNVNYLEDSWFTAIDPELHSFVNINTQTDLDEAKAILMRTTP